MKAELGGPMGNEWTVHLLSNISAACVQTFQSGDAKMNSGEETWRSGAGFSNPVT